MWSALATLILCGRITLAHQNFSLLNSNYKNIIYTSSFNITSLLVQADGSKYIQAESSELPSVFFTVKDHRFTGGSCIYVLEDLAAYEVLEGGRDTTSDYGSDRNVYFGAKDGLYIYDPPSLSAKKLGPFVDDIIQLQKANGTDEFYYLNSNNKMFKLENAGTVRTKLDNIACATQFVLDTSNNIYFVQCGDMTIHVIKSDGTVLALMASVSEDFSEVKLLRPAFIMDDSIPFFGDNILHVLYANGTWERKGLVMAEKPSAFSVDAALYLVAAYDGKIYEYNVLEMMLNSMFGMASSQDVGNVVLSLISSKDNLFNFYREWYDGN